MIAIFPASCYRQTRGFSVEAQREAVRRYLVSHHGEQIAEFVELESGKGSDRPQLAAAMALAKRRKASLLVAKLDRLSRSVAFISALMDSRASILPLPTCRGLRLTLHVLAAAAEHERHMIGERTRHALAAANSRGIKLGNQKQAEINRAKAAEQAQALRPRIERCMPHAEALAWSR
jgi:DNA invertase Pin-like site-specific DNA recombinase